MKNFRTMKRCGQLSAGLMLAMCSMLLCQTPAFGAAVTAVSAKKRLVKIDEGTDTGFAKGTTVCFLSKDSKKVACGKVKSAKPKFAFIRVSAKRIKMVKKGMPAQLSAPGKGKAGEIAADKEAPVTPSGKDHRRNIKGAYVISPMTPTSFNKLTYKAPSLDSSDLPEGNQATLWESSGANTLSIFGAQFEFEMGLFKSHAISFGLRMIYYRDFIAQSDYDNTNYARYVETELTASAMGFYSDYTFLDIAFTESFFWRTSAGLDFDMSSVAFKATQKDSEGGETAEIASATSKLNVLSLRLNTHLNWMIFDPLGADIGLNLLLPATTFGGSFSAKTNDPNEDLLASGDSKKDLEEALAHEKKSLGAEIIFGAFFVF